MELSGLHPMADGGLLVQILPFQVEGRARMADHRQLGRAKEGPRLGWMKPVSPDGHAINHHAIHEIDKSIERKSGHRFSGPLDAQPVESRSKCPP
ncbi:MAG: hypothetical protein K9H25_21155 [Rhodospirillum sp.]|nr:hypothetical protein [Rhodospirillum sp.]